jgi:hypothetical protein
MDLSLCSAEYEIEYLVPVEGGVEEDLDDRVGVVELCLEWAPLSDGPVVLRLAT